ncbi:prolipoprotein diacylglyceryl transferase, partial [bacterium]|nr:prolipoprotein diacylglyceryl transferase [bacterium]
LAPQHDPLEILCEVQAACGPYHHAGLYDLLGAAVLLGVLFAVSSRAKHLRYGMLFVMWAGWYGFQRFLIDFTRNTDLANADATLGPLTWNQWSGLTIGVVAIGTLVWMARGGTRRVDEETDIEYGAVPPDAAAVAAG